MRLVSLKAQAREALVFVGEAQGAADGPRHQQVALDVPAPPGVEGETELVALRRGRRAAIVAVEHAETPRRRSGAARAAQVLEGAGGLPAPQDHGGAGQGLCE